MVAQARTADILRFTVNHPFPDPVTNAFVAVVNRLLPNAACAAARS
jgi:hypothetical protein